MFGETIHIHIHHTYTIHIQLLLYSILPMVLTVSYKLVWGKNLHLGLLVNQQLYLGLFTITYTFLGGEG